MDQGLTSLLSFFALHLMQLVFHSHGGVFATLDSLHGKFLIVLPLVEQSHHCWFSTALYGRLVTGLDHLIMFYTYFGCFSSATGRLLVYQSRVFVRGLDD